MTFPSLPDNSMKKIYKKRIAEYMYTEKGGLNCMQRYLTREKLDSSTKCLSELINFIWRSYAYDMGKKITGGRLALHLLS